MSEHSGQPKKDDLIGKTLGQFEILEEIGRGGMATVYRARQMTMNRVVAVKILPRHLLHDPGFYERFEREVDVIAHLEHPHILPIYDYGESDGVPYIVMRYLAGGSMAQLIRRGGGLVPINQLEKPFVQVAQALDYAHQQGIIHRDLKPGNVMLDESGNAYLSDFGIARVLGSNLTGSQIIGTPAYMSPEQANGLPLDSRSDIYSLGVVLFELITGREPYQAETPMALLLKHINEPIPPIKNYRDDVPEAVEGVVGKATAKDPNARYPSAGDMGKGFQEALHTPNTAPTRKPAPTPEDPPTYVPAATPLPGASIPAPVTGMPVAAAPNRMPLIVGGIVGLIVIVGVIAVIAITRPPDPTPTPPPPSSVPTEVSQQADAIPTAPSGFQTVRNDQYVVSIPNNWIQGFIDLSDDERAVHLWQGQDREFYVALETPRNVSISDSNSFQTAVNDYESRYLTTRPSLTLIDGQEDIAEGWIRRSYRMVGATNPDFPPGQLDVFYLNRAPYLIVVNSYSADSTGDTLVPAFQTVLDSLRVRPEGGE
jgi:serine/threonine protein kinase